MKKIIAITVLLLAGYSCDKKKENSSVDRVNWESRMVPHAISDSMVHGSTYLSVYSQIYSQTEHKTHDLTATISLRNTNLTDTIYIDKAEYFDTGGKSIRTYFDQTIFVSPMETVEIVIDELDKEGGTGGNLLFEWRILPSSAEPLFESVMISTSGSQGLSFATQGKRIK